MPRKPYSIIHSDSSKRKSRHAVLAPDRCLWAVEFDREQSVELLTAETGSNNGAYASLEPITDCSIGRTMQDSLKAMRRLLSDVARFAQTCESAVLPAHKQPPFGWMAFGSLIRGRRLARAILQLAGESSYESRLQLRALLEVYYNYSWIRLRPKRRANRYYKWGALELLRLAPELPAEQLDARAKEAVASLTRRRAKYRHLFRVRDKNGKLRWVSDWADRSFAARIREVEVGKGGLTRSHDDFTYVVYRWLCGTSHGSPSAYWDMMEAGPGAPNSKASPDSNLRATLGGSTVLLLGILTHCETDLNFSMSMQARLSRLSERLGQLLADERARQNDHPIAK